ncbi:hypothetical protein GA0070613_3902 [Micromonospora inositola]|uniref:Uncharacterized protein n=1 Tax=Micromonospora inositola TaxID=47865 RepID=A0A1C5J3L4_9ACTN|nr:hypothetical protein GA0070613_3902 [Micromonospora inositola]
MKGRDSGDRGDGMDPRITAKAANRPPRQATVSYLTVTSQLRAGHQVGRGPFGEDPGAVGVETLAVAASRAMAAGTRRPER